MKKKGYFVPTALLVACCWGFYQYFVPKGTFVVWVVGDWVEAIRFAGEEETIQMIKSQYNTFPCWIILIGCSFSMYEILSMSYLVYNYPASRNIINFIALWIAGFILFSTVGIYTIKKILINRANKIITVNNFLFGKARVYNFSELDGYYDMMIKHGRSGTSYEAISIVKNKKVVLKIDSYYYSNFYEMRQGLTELKYLGMNIDLPKLF